MKSKLFGLVTLAALLFLTACSSPCSQRRAALLAQGDNIQAAETCPFKKVNRSEL